MRKLESIKDFYQQRLNWTPDEIRNNLGHFNVMPLEAPIIGKGAEDLEYGRREWYNIVLVFGGGIFQYSGKDYPVKKHAIAFSNPHTPFGWLQRNKITKGYFCLFNEQFLQKEKHLIDYPPFKTNSIPFYELTKEEADKAEALFLRMSDELKSDYIYKYDVEKILIEELLHITMKSVSFGAENKSKHTASERTTLQFLELLERQFPIEEPTYSLTLITASDFAKALNVHVNHLNKSVKDVTEKTTTNIIKERILHEAQNLIKFTNWNFSEIAYSLGFKEVTHFNNFFKKSTGLNPSQFRSL